MYRIVREENLLNNKVLYFIEEYRGWFFKSWTRELSITDINGCVGGQTLDGAKTKLAHIKSGEIITKEIVYNDI